MFVNKALAAWLGSLLLAGAAHAATECRFLTGGAVAFGSYDIFSAAPDDSLLNVYVQCTRNGGPQNVSVTLQLSAGLNGSSASARRMANSGSAGGYLSYGLFRDSGRTAVWGFSTGVDTVSQTLSIPNHGVALGTFVIYGRIPAQQDAAAGSYSDRVQMTLTP